MKITFNGVILYLVIFMEEQQPVKKQKRSRQQSLGEEIGNAVTHGCGAIFAIVALVMMLLKQDSGLKLASAIIFGCSMFFVYLSSCLYHCFKRGSKVKKLFRIFDHSSIFIQIAGTYAPILLCLIGGWIGWTYFAVQWAIVVAGILLRILHPQKNTVPQVILCLLLGWSGISILPQMYQCSPIFLVYILAGGVAYSGGIAFYAGRFKYAHFVWHFFVLFGTILHFIGIYLFIF